MVSLSVNNIPSIINLYYKVASKIDVDLLSSLNNKSKYKYLGNYQKLGEGSSRVVFDLGEGRVLKMAKNLNGLKQNEVEYKNSQSANADIFPKCFYQIDKFKIICCEKVTPYDNTDTLGQDLNFEKQLTNYTFEYSICRVGFRGSKDLEELIDKAQMYIDNSTDGGSGGDDIKCAIYLREIDTLKDALSSETFVNIINKCCENNLQISELEEVEHWGKTVDGKIVILDSGF